MTTIVEFPDRRVVAEEAAQWLIRLDADTAPSREELRALGEWLGRSPAHREELENLAALWGRMNVLTELAVPLGSSSRPAGRAQPWRRVGLVTAALAVVLALSVLLIEQQSQPDRRLATNGLYATAVGQQRTAALADGSQVILNTNTQIRVDYSQGYRRVHLLQGEALFTVAKDAARPFRVYAGNGRIEALGTAFSVHLDGGHINVAVTEGRVSLASMASATQLPSQAASRSPAASGSAPGLPDDLMRSLGTLEAGHVATIRAAQPAPGSIAALEAVQPVAAEELRELLAWRDGVLVFSGETLAEVVKEFSRYTTIAIEVPDARVRNMRVGGRFPVGETETMLAALETNFNLRVTRLGHNHVVLSAAEE